MNKKISIRFLRPGSVEVKAPGNFGSMTDDEKMEWAFAYIKNLSDKDLIQAMSDFDAKSTLFFDETPDVAAIEADDGLPIVLTDAWKTYHSENGHKTIPGTVKGKE